MNILHPPNDLDREGQILLALGDLYGLTIPQTMRLWGWPNYSVATTRFKSVVAKNYAYRIRRHGLGKETISGDVYFLLSHGAGILHEAEITPTFSFEPNKAKQIKPAGLTHTLLVNEAITKLKLFADAAVSRYRLIDIVHARSMRNTYKDAFKLYPDGFIQFFLKMGNEWKQGCCFLEVEHTSARDREKWTAKVRQYINLFEYKLQPYFNTDRTFVIILVTDAEYVRHLKNLTETILEDMGNEALTYRSWFCFAHFEQNLSPLQFYATNRFFTPFTKAALVPFPGLVLAPSRS